MRPGLQFAVIISTGVLFAGATGAVFANSGSVSQLSGTLSVRKADGSVRILSQKSEIQSGDTLNTQKDSYAQIKFADGRRSPSSPIPASRSRATILSKPSPRMTASCTAS